MGDFAKKSLNIKMRLSRTTFKSEPSAAVGVKLLLFVLCPFIGWLYAIKSANTKSSFAIFFMFSLLICWHFSPTGYNNGFDDFLAIYKTFERTEFNAGEIGQEIIDFITLSPNAPKELYQDVVTWFVKLFTDNYHWYFLLCAVPVALCQLSLLKRVVSDQRYRNCITCFIVLAMLIFPRDIITVQNPRFATGLWLCVIFTIKFYTEGHRFKYALPIFISPAIHSAMWAYVGIFIFSILFYRKTKVLGIMALVSIPFMFFDANFLQQIDVNILPPSLRGWFIRYMSDDFYNKYVLDTGKSGFWWVSASFDYLMKAMYIYMTWQIIKYRKIVQRNDTARKLYGFYLFLFAVVNMIQFVPVLGTRYYWILRIFCLFVWFKGLYGLGNYKRVLYLLLLGCSWDILRRYGYVLGGALSVNTPIDLFFAPLPYLLGKGLFW